MWTYVSFDSLDTNFCGPSFLGHFFIAYFLERHTLVAKEQNLARRVSSRTKGWGAHVKNLISESYVAQCLDNCDKQAFAGAIMWSSAQLREKCLLCNY
jgi:hypothetical protein